MKDTAVDAEIQAVKEKVIALGYDAHLIEGVERVVIAAVGDKAKEPLKGCVSMAGVSHVTPIRQPYKLASRSSKSEDTVIDVDGIKVGGGHFGVFAGPCSVESMEQTMAAADCISGTHAQFLRGGAYKPRTSPYSFQGLGEEGLQILKAAKEKTGLKIITELIQPKDAALVSEYADIIQIGARNMQNFALLKEAGKSSAAVFLKRGLAATLEDLLMAAEYIMSEGNTRVMLCERGIRTFETAYRNTLDLNAVPALKSMTHLPVIVDPSHGTGKREMVRPMALAAIAAGADGIMIEMHPNPDEAWSDGPQSLTPPQFEELMDAIKPYLALAGKRV